MPENIDHTQFIGNNMAVTGRVDSPRTEWIRDEFRSANIKWALASIALTDLKGTDSHRLRELREEALFQETVKLGDMLSGSLHTKTS